MAAQSISTLEGIPDEIVLNILQNFIVPNSSTKRLFDRGTFNKIKTGVHHLNACSKRLHEISTPFLYHTISQSSTGSIPLLLKKILSKHPHSHNGRFIKRIFADAGVHNLDMSPLTEFNIKQCTSIFRSATSTKALSNFTSSFAAGEWDAVLALLLCLAPNLEYIELLDQGHTNRGVSSGNFFIEQVLDKAAEGQLQLQLQPSESKSNNGEGDAKSPILTLAHLNSASLYYHDTEMGMGLDTTMPFLSLPSMHSLLINALIISQYDVPPSPSHTSPQSPPQPYNLKHLTVCPGAINGDALIRLMPHFPLLESITYYHSIMVAWEDFFPQKWGEALSTLTSTLKYLDLQGEIARDVQDEAVEGIGSLADFEYLEEIIAEWDILHGPSDAAERDYDLDSNDEEVKVEERERLVDILPESLVRLEVSGVDEVFCEEMVKVLKEKEERVPRLEVLTVTAKYGCQDIGVGLARACRDAGVRLRFSGLGERVQEVFELGD